VVEDPTVAVRGANAVYTDTWSSMGDPEDQREARGVAFRRYQVDRALMSLAASDAVFLHCLPAHRGEKVTAEVIGGPRSLVFEQAENRLHTAQVLVKSLLLDELSGLSHHAGAV
jgi:ornithine carbamoyltransferase